MCEYCYLSPFISFDLFVSPFICLYLGVYLYFHSSVYIRCSIDGSLSILPLMVSILVLLLYLLSSIELSILLLSLLLVYLLLSILIPILVLILLTMMIICSSGGFLGKGAIFWENLTVFDHLPSMADLLMIHLFY